MQGIKPNMHHPLVKGKTCVVVAPSRYLRGRGKQSAEFISSFDLVVKTTDMCEMDDPVGELGNRCDIWYGMPGNASGWRVDIPALHEQGVKLMILQPFLEQYSQVWHEYLDWFKQQSLPQGLSYEFADTEAYQQLIEKFDSLPLSGVFAIFDLLNKGAEKVFAYGHDFYRSGYFFDSDFQAKTQLSHWHKLDTQMSGMWQLKQHEPRFACDPNLNYLIEEKYKPDFNAEEAFSRIVSEELRFFNKSYPFGSTLLVRTCNIVWFKRILAEFLEPGLCSELHVLVQQSLASDILQASLSQATSSQSSLSQAISSQVTSSQASPSQAISSQASLSQAISSQASPSQAISSQVTSSQASPSQAISSQDNSSQANDPMHLHRYRASERFALADLQSEIALQAGKIDTAIVPYNGLELWTYLDVFKYLLSLEVNNVFLISTRGVVRRLTNLNNECQSIEEFLSIRNKFNQYVQRYDRRNCI